MSDARESFNGDTMLEQCAMPGTRSGFRTLLSRCTYSSKGSAFMRFEQVRTLPLRLLTVVKMLPATAFWAVCVQMPVSQQKLKSLKSGFKGANRLTFPSLLSGGPTASTAVSERVRVEELSTVIASASILDICWAEWAEWLSLAEWLSRLSRLSRNQFDLALSSS